MPDTMNNKKDDLGDRLEALKKSYMLQLDDRISALEGACVSIIQSASAAEREGGLRSLLGLGHKLAGSAGTFGLPELSQVASKIEIRCEHLIGNIESLDETVSGELSGLVAECRKLAT